MLCVGPELASAMMTTSPIPNAFSLRPRSRRRLRGGYVRVTSTCSPSFRRAWPVPTTRWRFPSPDVMPQSLQVGAAEQPPGGLPGEVEDELVRPGRPARSSRRAAARGRSSRRAGARLVPRPAAPAAGARARAAPRPPGTAPRSRRQPVVAGEQSVERVGQLGRRAREVGGRDTGISACSAISGLAVDDAQAAHLPDAVFGAELQGVGERAPRQHRHASRAPAW